MSKKRSYNTEEALQIFLEPDLNSKIKKIKENVDEDPDWSPVTPLPKIWIGFTVGDRFCSH